MGLSRRGLSVALLGPDGAGKSTLAGGLASGLGVRVHYVYFGLGPASGGRLARFGPPGQLASLWWRYLVARGYQALGRVVIFDRHPCEARLPARTRLSHTRRLTRWLRARALPEPDLALVLDAHGSVMHARKFERTPEELELERRDFLALSRSLRRLCVVDATRSPAEVRAQAADHVRRYLTQR
jgi:thymidylate kinase